MWAKMNASEIDGRVDALDRTAEIPPVSACGDAWNRFKNKLRDNKWLVVTQLALIVTSLVPVIMGFVDAPKVVALTCGLSSSVVAVASLAMQVADRPPAVQSSAS